MGTYYLIACHEHAEFVNPARIGLGGNKAGAIVNGDAARLFAHLHIYGTERHQVWTGTLVNDSTGIYEELLAAEYIDITETVVKEFNETWPESPIAMFNPPPAPSRAPSPPPRAPRRRGR